MKCTPLVLVLALWAVLPAAATELTIVGQEYPPFNWSESGQVRGGMVDVLRAACDKLHYQCHFQIVPLARAIKMLQDGSADAVMSLIPNAERAAFARFSPVLVVNHLSYFGIQGQATPHNKLQDLRGWTVAAVRGSASLQLARQHQQLVGDQIVVEEVNNETLVKKLQAGRYGEQGAIFGGEAVLTYEADKIHLALEPVLRTEAQHFVTAFSRKSMDAPTFDALYKALEALKKNGEVKRILKPYGLKSAP